RVPIPVELGAEFLHGRPPELWNIIEQENLVVGSLEGSDWCAETHELRKCTDFWPRWRRIARCVKRAKTYPDRTFSEFIDAVNVELETKNSAIKFVQGINAAPADRISVQYLASAQESADRLSGDTPFRVFRGLATIIQALGRFPSGQVDIHLNTPVREIEWRC